MTEQDELLERLRTALTDRYRFVRRIGSGGMGSVYLAEDLELGRPVAIKVMRPELLHGLGPDRFLLEIEIAGRLHHPHIVPIHRKGSVADLVYYEMPYAEGETLRDRLEREPQLPLEVVLRIAHEVARALDHAHTHGVLHRDIKPENILLQAGVAQVTDFGIARALGAPKGKRLTETGMTVGTPAYMSPEQVMGEEVDGRSDVYSLACVVYEMLAGQPPFTGPDAVTVATQHLSAPIPDVRRLRPATPAAVATAFSRGLAKSRADRFETAQAFANALGPLLSPSASSEATTRLGGSPVPGTPSDHTPGASDARGSHRVRAAVIAWVVVATLVASGWAIWRALRGADPGASRARVIVAEFDAPPDDPVLADVGRTLVEASFDESRAFATVPEDQVRRGLELAGLPDSSRMVLETACELAERGGFPAVVTGQIVKAGDGYAIVLRAIDPRTRMPRGTERASASSADELLHALGTSADRLRRTLGEHARRADPEEPIGTVATPSLEAYRFYARGVRADRRGEPSLELFQEAVAVDSAFAAAWVCVSAGLINERANASTARAALQRALRHPERLGPMQRRDAEASLALLEFDAASALQAYERMLQLDPGDLTALAGRAFALLALGRFEEALDDYRRLEELSPFGPTAGMLWNRMLILQWSGRLEQARALIPRIPGAIGRSAPLADAFWSGDWPRAIRLAGEIESDGSTALRERGIAVTYASASHAALGHVGEAFAVLDRADEWLTRARLPARLWLFRYRLAAVSGERRGIDGVLESRDDVLPLLLGRALCHAAFGDTSVARALLGRLGSHPALELAEAGASPSLLEAEIEARGGRWGRVVELLREHALQGESGLAHFGATQPFLCWRMADAFEGLGQPDSAIAYLERSLPDFGPNEVLVSATTQSAFARRRLVALHVKLGHVHEARRHLAALVAQIDSTDAEARALVRAPRSWVATAQAPQPGAAR